MRFNVRHEQEFPTWREVKQQTQRQYLERLLEYTGGNVSACARLADKDRGELYRYLKNYGLDPKAYKRKKAARKEPAKPRFRYVGPEGPSA